MFQPFPPYSDRRLVRLNGAIGWPNSPETKDPDQRPRSPVVYHITESAGTAEDETQPIHLPISVRYRQTIVTTAPIVQICALRVRNACPECSTDVPLESREMGADHRYRELPPGVRRTSVDGRPDGPPSDLPEYASVPVTARDPKRREAFRRVAWLTSPGSTVQRARRFPERTRAPKFQRDGGRPRPETWSRRVSRRVRPSADKTRWRSPACAATNVDRATRNRFLVEVR